MRALVCRQWGNVDDLEVAEVDRPTAGDNQVMIEVAASCANYADAIMVGGTYQTKPPFPFSPGLEAAGTVAGLETCHARRPRDGVVALWWHGRVCRGGGKRHLGDPRDDELGRCQRVSGCVSLV